MSKIYLAVDNGTSGNVAILYPDGTSYYCPTPSFQQLSYTKTKQWISRLDHIAFRQLIQSQVSDKNLPVYVIFERPMVNPMRFKASMSAMRCLEAELVVIESLGLAPEYADSKAWQRVMLPAGLVKDELKKASRDIGKRLFPQHKIVGDADALLMAEWARRSNL